ncbi:MAG: hypothetical protein AB4058_21790 [Microcystaceae cyanobacterium]
MPYVTSFERIARQEGIVQNGREAILEVLEVHFSSFTSELAEIINQLEDTDCLKTLHREAITVGSLAEFQEYLEQMEV